MKHKDLSKLDNTYNNLPIEERLRRMEFLAQYYLNSLTADAKVVVDAVKYWPQFEAMMEEGIE